MQQKDPNKILRNFVLSSCALFIVACLSFSIGIRAYILDDRSDLFAVGILLCVATLGLISFNARKMRRTADTMARHQIAGTYTEKIKVAGVTFNNKDGSSRQDILASMHAKNPPFDKKWDIRIEQFMYEGAPAFYIKVNGQCVGCVPKEKVHFIMDNKSNLVGIREFNVFPPEIDEFTGEKIPYYANFVIELRNEF